MGLGDATRIEAIKNGVRVTVWDWETVKKSIALQTVAKLRDVFIDKWTKKFVKRGLNIFEILAFLNFSILKRALIN